MPPINEIVRLYTEGLTPREIGERFGISREYVRRLLKREGVTLRKHTKSKQCEEAYQKHRELMAERFGKLVHR